MTNWDTGLQSWLYQFVSADGARFGLALWLSDYVPWILCAVVLAILWFAGGSGTEFTGINSLRGATRERVVLTFLAMFAAFLLVRPFEQAFARAYPLQTASLAPPIDPTVWASIRSAVAGTSSFPSDQTAFWFALVAGVFTYSRAGGTVIGILMLGFALLRVGVGYAYPVDALAGSAIGVLMFLLLFLGQNSLRWITRPVVRVFNGLPMVAYPLGLLVLFDVAQRMNWIMSALGIFLNIALRRS